ncbi:hypothetical protein Lal_00034885 [Lupinus albus]|uniref:Exocyst subunit Exo70 family protein n=1 Tax=Lupinus albus TaxID=3870 RepID=A0A6A4QTR8_LUPAL|nr:putative exocyst complex component Exo70, cullin repeat-like-containing domain-containing protein [Lupinus albus]KAF1897182.1 hypothetical protein Lal_00034885 [Lupinus albus]
MPRKGMRSVFYKPSPFPSSSVPPSSPQRTFSDSLMQENIETAEFLITKSDSVTNHSSSSYAKPGPLFSGTRFEAKQYLNAVKGLQTAMKHLLSQDPTSKTLVRSQFLMQLAMKTLQKELCQILSSNREHLDPETVSNRSSTDTRSSFSDFDDEISVDNEFRIAGNSISETERMSMIAMADLKAIADCMISSGYGKECVKVYITMRKSIVDEALYHLGVERLSFSRVNKMDWEVVELKVKTWLNALKVAVSTLFHGERILCDHVFAAALEKRIAESCFAEITRDSTALLFGLPEMVAKCNKTPEKIFKTLDLYEAISDNWPQIESIFSYQSTSRARSLAVNSMVKLGDAIRAMLSEFESSIQKESSKVPVPAGGVHPLARYVLNYVTFLADYSGVLGNIITDYPQSPLPENYYRSPMRNENPLVSDISERIAWLILVVLCKIDAKAELYNDVALSYLFLVNNMQYVVEKVRKSNLGFLLGEDWLTKHKLKVEEYVSKYERVGWSKVLSSLPENPTAEMTAEQVRACYMNFNAAFQETCRKQSAWVVTDPKLRKEIKISIGSIVVSRYKKFYERHRSAWAPVNGFKPEDIGNYLSDILYGIGDSSHSYSTTSSCHRSNRGRRNRYSL